MEGCPLHFLQARTYPLRNEAHGSAALAVQCKGAQERSFDLVAYARVQAMSSKCVSQGSRATKARVIPWEVRCSQRPCSQRVSFIGQITNLLLLPSPSPKTTFCSVSACGTSLKFCPLSSSCTSLHVKPVLLKPVLTDPVSRFHWLLLH